MKKRQVSLIIFLLSLSLLCSYYIYYYFLDKRNTELIEDYYIKVDSNSTFEPVVNKIETKKEEYFGILSIPKIKLKTGFYNKNSKNNNVNKNVMLLKDSIMPNENGSIIYLAAHSGTGYLAYFKNINKLTNEDIINVSINNKDYQYSVFDIYEVVRNGSIIVKRNINEKYLVLTTCSNNKNMQLVIIAKMINKV